jgi:uncharacterized membrane protein YczE
MDFLLILLGILIIPIGIFATAPKDRTVSTWLGRSVFFAIGVVLIILGIMFRMHRYR